MSAPLASRSRMAEGATAPGPLDTIEPIRAPLTDAQWQALHEAACAPYRPVGRFAWHFARGKLGRDPVFRRLVEAGWLCGRPGLRVLDIGCGQGLLASLLDAAARAGLPGAPVPLDYTGIELMPRDIARAERAAAALSTRPRYVCGDMREAAFPRCDAVVILDVLHYVDHEAQRRVLQKVRAALLPGGRLLLRVGDAASPRGFAISQWVDRTVTRIRGHRVSPTWGRPLREWLGLLAAAGFDVEALPMSQGTPFANVLLVAQRREVRAA